MPKELKTLGEHLRARRIERGRKQREVAQMIGVTESTIWLWERNRVEPRANFVPGIFDFLGYCLIEPVESWRTRLRRTRVAMGWTQKRLAAEVGLNESTIQGWQSGRRKPIIVSQTKVDALFKELAAASRSEKSGL